MVGEHLWYHLSHCKIRLLCRLESIQLFHSIFSSSCHPKNGEINKKKKRKKLVERTTKSFYLTSFSQIFWFVQTAPLSRSCTLTRKFGTFGFKWSLGFIHRLYSIVNSASGTSTSVVALLKMLTPEISIFVKVIKELLGHLIQ